jgi:hypothetical protein
MGRLIESVSSAAQGARPALLLSAKRGVSRGQTTAPAMDEQQACRATQHALLQIAQSSTQAAAALAWNGRRWRGRYSARCQANGAVRLSAPAIDPPVPIR